MSNLVKIDELIIGQHWSLSQTDECYYLLEYTARQRPPLSRGNDLIMNLKKPMDRKGRPEWRYKEWAINEIARELRSSLSVVIDFPSTTIIPIPPSKIRTNPLYDDRNLKTLRKACPTDADIRELIIGKKDMSASHESDFRPSVAEILDNYTLNPNIHPEIRENIVLFDDVVTAGSHYVACRQFLEGYWLLKKIKGVFVARRVVQRSMSFGDFTDFS